VKGARVSDELEEPVAEATKRAFALAERLGGTDGLGVPELRILFYLGACASSGQTTMHLVQVTGTHQTRISKTVTKLRDLKLVEITRQKREGPGQPMMVVSLAKPFAEILDALAEARRREWSIVDADLVWLRTMGAARATNPQLEGVDAESALIGGLGADGDERLVE